MTGLTEKQQAILDWMLAYQSSYAMPPTVREVMAQFGFQSTNAVTNHFVAMEKKGYLKHYPNASRGWCPAKRSIFTDCPYCGKEIEVEEEL